MKKITSALLLSSSILFAQSECPKIDLKNSGDKESMQVLAELKGMDSFKQAYIDVLKKYNNTNDAKPYMSEESAIALSNTRIFSKLVVMLETNDLKEYDRVLNTIDSNNNDWCKPESYNK